LKTSSKGRLGPVQPSARPVASFFTDRTEPTVDRQPRVTDSVAVDEVARQRQKRSAAWRDQLVSGTATVTVGQLADQATAAATGAATSADADTVTRFLRDRGHTPATIENVIRCLALDRGPGPEPDGTIQSLVPASSGEQRLRTVAQLEAMLRED
jgi:hypothetical protein